MADDIGLSALESIEADATVQAITTRFFAGVLPQNATLPAGVIDVISNVPLQHLKGSGLSIARVRVDAYADTRSAANNLAETIRTEVMKNTHKGTLGVANTLNVREITLTAGPYWDRERPQDGSDAWRQFVRSDYLVTYKPTGPS